MAHRSEKFRFFFEVDNFCHAGFRKPQYVNNSEDVLETLVIAVKSFQNRFPNVGHAVIKQTDNGFHVCFPQLELPSMNEYDMVLQNFPCDVHWRNWCRTKGEATLRVTRKAVIVKANGDEQSRCLGVKKSLFKPQTIRIIRVDGQMLCTKQIQEFYGDS